MPSHYYNQEGDGFVQSAIDFTRQIIKGRDKLGASSQRKLDKFRDFDIEGVKIVRKPITKGIVKLTNKITKGEFKKDMLKAGYDDLFHLRVDLKLRGGPCLTIEKNETVTISRGKCEKLNEDGLEIMDIEVKKPRTLGEAYDKMTRGYATAKNLYDYDSVNNNCQKFSDVFLTKNKDAFKYTAEDRKFVKQDVKFILDKYTKLKKGAKLVTNLGQRLSLFLTGAGDRDIPERPTTPGPKLIDDEEEEKMIEAFMERERQKKEERKRQKKEERKRRRQIEARQQQQQKIDREDEERRQQQEARRRQREEQKTRPLRTIKDIKRKNLIAKDIINKQLRGKGKKISTNNIQMDMQDGEGLKRIAKKVFKKVKKGMKKVDIEKIIKKTEKGIKTAKEVKKVYDEVQSLLGKDKGKEDKQEGKGRAKTLRKLQKQKEKKELVKTKQAKKVQKAKAKFEKQQTKLDRKMAKQDRKIGKKERRLQRGGGPQAIGRSGNVRAMTSNRNIHSLLF